MSFSQNEATRLVRAVDRRVQKQLGRGTVLEYTNGEVDVVGVGEASAFLGGDTNASEGFRIPPGVVVESGDRVKVAIDPRGDRYITGVISPTTYPKATFDPIRGAVSFGDGTAAPAQGLRYDTTNDIVVFDDGALGDTGATHHLGELRLYRASGAQYVLLTDPTNLNASQVAFAMKNTGEMQWGPSGAARDVTLYRASTGILESTGGIKVIRASADTAFSTRQSTDTNDRIRLQGSGTLSFGSGTATPDAVLFRDQADRLRTNDELQVDSNLLLGSTASVNLYASTSNRLKTDDTFHAVDGLTTKTKAGIPTDGDFTITPLSGTLAVDTTNSRLYVRVGSTWKFAALT